MLITSLLTLFGATYGVSAWTLSNMNGYENNILAPFKAQSSGSFDEGSLSVTADPAGSSAKVLRVFYKKGSYIDIKDRRGAQFYGRPTSAGRTMTLSYDIYFSPGFDFVKGGKLPGLFGGATNCSGGRHSDACFSTRLMWRKDGDGEVYAYIPEKQVPSFCSDPGNTCDDTYGYSIGRGSWRFRAGVWQKIAQRVELNNPGKTDGNLKVWYNDKLVLQRSNVNFRNINLNVEGILFSTFFGGSDSSWAATKDCYTYYKNFVITA